MDQMIARQEEERLERKRRLIEGPPPDWKWREPLRAWVEDGVAARKSAMIRCCRSKPGSWYSRPAVSS
jgi:hypothetical protein